KLLLALDAGARTLAMAQRVVHHVAQVLAPDCAPLFLTDGFREYMTALLTHYGYWVQPPRRQGTGRAPKPRWMPLPQLPLCAGDQDRAPTASGPCEPPRGVRHPGGRRAGAVSLWLADQYRIRGTDQPHHPAACRCGRATGQHAVQGRGRIATAIGCVPLLL